MAKAIQSCLFEDDPPGKKTQVSIELGNLEDFMTMRKAVKEAHRNDHPGDGEGKEFDEHLSNLLQDIAVKKGDRSVSKYTTVKSVTGGVLNVGLLELTVVAVKELEKAGKEVEPFYDALLAIYITMIVIQVLGMMGLTFLAFTDFKTAMLEKTSMYNKLNNCIALLASVLLILGTVATGLKTDKNAVSIEKFVEMLKTQNVTVDFGKLLNQ